MAESHVKLKVGVTFLLAVLALFAGIYWLKEYSLTVDTIQMRVLFDDASGIAAGDPVTLAGVKVGQVDGIELTGSNQALITFSIPGNVILHPDAVFRITDVGVLGDKKLVIDPGTVPGTLNPDTVQKGMKPLGTEELLAMANTVLSNLRNITAKIDREVDFRQINASFDATLRQVRQSAAAYGNIADRNRRTIDALLGNLNELTVNLNAIVEANGGQGSETLRNINQAALALTRLAEELQPLGIAADSLASSAQTGAGTIWKLLQSGELYNELRSTNAVIDSLISDIRRNPDLYLKNIKLKFELF